ncbi:MAG: UDP-N-acetylglucosamine 2-epimerase, partial [Clostridia bacterium]
TLHVIYPMHPNPAVSEAARAVLGDCAQALLLPPLDVKDLHNLMQRCTLVMTDSGGLQEEAPSLHKPVLVLRTETERQEVVACGAARLVGVAEDAVYAQAKMLLADGEAYRTMAQAGNPYGDGQAAGRIVEAICAWDTQGRPVA